MGRVRVLIVDDDPVVVESIRMTLEDLDYEVVATATSGAEAVHKTGELGPDLVLMDIGLPGSLDGIEAATRIHDEWKTPVVYLTATAEEDLVERAKISCAQGYVLKPFRADGLHTVLQMALHRRVMEQQLEESESRYRTLLEALPQRIFYKTCDSVYISCNERYARDFDITAHEIAGKTDEDFFPPEMAQAYRVCDEQVLASGETNTIEEKYTIRGEDLWVQTVKTPVRDEEGNVRGLLGMSWDISLRKRAEEELERYRDDLEERVREKTAELQRTNRRLEQEIAERKRAELELREREKQYRLVADQVSDNIWILRLSDLKMEYSSPSVEKILGYRPEEMLNLPTERLLPPESRELISRIIEEEVLNEGESGLEPDRARVFELEQIRKDGQRAWTEITASFLRDEEGKPDRVLGVTRDVTERKRAEEALRASEEKYRLVVENTIDGVFIAQDGVMKFANPVVSAITGYGPEELARVPFSQIMHPEDRERAMDVHRKRLAGEELAAAYTFRVIAKGGEQKWVEVGGTSITWEGRPATLSFVRDITERKNLESQLRETQKMEAIGTLAGGIAHDFNNILQIILGYTELARQETFEDDSLQAILREVINAGKRGRDLAGKILTFSRHADQEAKNVELVSIVREALQFLRASLPTTIQLREDLRVESGMVSGDPTGIYQILINLCTNAGHAMIEHGGELVVGLSQQDLDADAAALFPELKPGAYLTLTVSDTGHGMDSSTRNRIFEPFFTTKGQGEGTGMGLSVVHGIVKAHGGAIRVESEVGEGTTFLVLLPELEGVATSSVEEQPTGEVRPARVLFVDDEKSLVKLHGQMLRRLGHEVTALTNSQEALESFRQTPQDFDLVITDMTMPGLTGTDMAKEMLRIRPEIPILLCTGFSESVDLEKAREIGIRDMLMKPTMKGELEKAIQQALAGS